MPDRAAILEDNADRVAEMRAALFEVMPSVIPHFFDNSREMIDWFEEHVGDVIFISLDHDLPVKRVDGQLVDCGTGREASRFMASRAPTCPVIVHSSNVDAARSMVQDLRGSGWPARWVVPRDGNRWIREVWAAEVKLLKSQGWFER